jgi:hypothetical protein
MMYRALMLEGRHTDRGRVLESHTPFLAVAFYNDDPRRWNVSEPEGYSVPSFIQVRSDWMRINLFGAITRVWVPGYLNSERERNMWALVRLIDPAIARAMSDVTDFPAEWFTENVQSTRTGAVGELPAGRKEIEGHV